MATTATDAFREAVALAAANQGTWITLHSGPPGLTGANELSGGTPAYARKQVVWTGGSADGIVVGSEVEFNVPAASGAPITVTHIGCRTAETGGTFLWSQTLPGEGITFPGPGLLKVIPRPRINVSA